MTIFDPYIPIAGSIASFLKSCKRAGITTIDGALATYDQHIASVAQTMRPASVVTAARAATPGLLRCPDCGAALETKQLCPHVSPTIRTQLACTNDACSWWGQSKNNVAWLIRHGLGGVETGG